MAGPPDYSIMYFVSVPAALCAAFFSRRQRTSKRMLGFVAFSIPVLVICSWMYYGLATAREARYAALAGQWLMIAVITLVAEFVASFVFAANSDRPQEVRP
jgi:formate hydrogenlyase subunit 3/multisubunit Na+/H+ antiporter MnhD subunit